LVPRTIKTIHGKVFYWRNYLIDKNGGGFYPLDSLIGLTSDDFTPLVMSLATKLATRVSFPTSVLLFRCFYGWSPSSEAIQSLVLGMGRDSSAYMEQVGSPNGDGNSNIGVYRDGLWLLDMNENGQWDDKSVLLW